MDLQAMLAGINAPDSRFAPDGVQAVLSQGRDIPAICAICDRTDGLPADADFSRLSPISAILAISADHLALRSTTRLPRESRHTWVWANEGTMMHDVVHHGDFSSTSFIKRLAPERQRLGSHLA
jgi:hypothetical protein